MIYQKIALLDNREDVTLTSYVLDDSTEILAGKPRAAILICPGGAYLGCSDREAEPIAMAFAAMGYHAFVLHYSVYIGGTGFPDLSKPFTPNGNSQFPNQLRELGKAILYIRSKANEWLVDVNKIVICGFSAGGHNCAMYSVYWNKPLMTDYLGVNADILRPAACILCYPLTDYFLTSNNSLIDPRTNGLIRLANTALTGSENPSDELMQQLSPARLVDANTPPTFLWTTREDNLLPVAHTTAMAHALAINNIPFELHIFEKGVHGLSLATSATAGDKSGLDADASKWIGLCNEWLKKRFEPDVPEVKYNW